MNKIIQLNIWNSRHITCAFILGCCFFMNACKKDLINFSSVQKLDSHVTDSTRFNKILFVNDSVGFIVGGQRSTQATILTTHDGGYTWARNDYPGDGTGIYGITQAPGGMIYTIGYGGKMLYSSDTGKTWTFNQLYDWELTDIAYADADHGIIVGGINFSGGYQVYIGNNGAYQRQYYFHYQLNKVKMANATVGYMTGYGLVQKSTDGAQNWVPLDIKGDDFMGLDIHNNGNEVWVCGYNGCVYHTADAGNTWQKQRDGNDIAIAHYHLLDIIFKDEMNGWAVGENGLVIYSDDGGNHWMQYNKFTSNALRSIAICPNGDLLVTGDNGALYRFASTYL